MKHYVYDLEVYKNVFTATFVSLNKTQDATIAEYIKAKIAGDTIDMEIALGKLDYHVFVISEYDSSNTSHYNLRDFMSQELILYGFNSHGYDDIILGLCLNLVGLEYNEVNRMLYEASDHIITSQFLAYDDPLSSYKYRKAWLSIDLQALYHLGYKGLKMVAIAMKYPFIQDLPINPHRSVLTNEVTPLLSYNLNDVLMTRMMIKLKPDELQSRIDAMQVYDLKPKILSASRPEMAKLVIGSYIEKLNGGNKGYIKERTFRRSISFNKIILEFDFKIPEFKTFYEHMRTITIVLGVDKFSEQFTYNNITYQFGMGGLHTKDTPAVFIANDNYEYIDVDADSYYPFIIINHNFEPKHLIGLFLTIYRLITTTRIKAKKAAKDKLLEQADNVKNKKIADILKIVINSSFGMFNDAHSYLYDPLALFSTTVNGQLGLLYVAEKIILAGSEIVSVNTDGLVSKVHKNNKVNYEAASIQAFADFKATCEFTYYKKYVRTTVNDYLTIKTDGTIKLKGDFEYNKLVLHDGFSKGFNMPIVAFALVEYYTKGKSVKTTIHNHTDIYDFCLSSNIGSQFRLMRHAVVNGKVIEEQIQKHVRYYISRVGSSLVKVDMSTSKKTRLTAGYSATIFNDYVEKSMSNYNINHSFYIKEAYKLIDKIEKRSTKIMRKTTGTLFDL